MQAIDVARARGLLASQENHHKQIKKTTSGLVPGLPWDMGLTAVDVDRQLTIASEEKCSSSWLVVMLGCFVPHVGMYES